MSIVFFLYFLFPFFRPNYRKVLLLLNLLERKKEGEKPANCNAVVQNGRESTCYFTAVDCTVVVVVVVDRFDIAVFSALEQTHCARM